MNKPKEEAARFVVRRLYKDLLKITKRFDNEPTSKVLIYRNSIEPTSTCYSSTHYNEILNEFLAKKNLFLPQNVTPPLYEIVRFNFRKKNNSTLFDETPLRVDTAFSLFRKLSSIWKCFTSLETMHGKVITPYLSPVSLASALGLSTNKISSLPSVKLSGKISNGTILVSHPLVQGPMRRACILILEHSSKGSYGLVINRPTDHDLGYAVKNLPMDIYNKFRKANVSFGGMVRRLQYLHNIPSCGGSIIPGCSEPLFAGGDITKAMSIVSQQSSLLKAFQFYVGCCKWDSGQLQQELDRGFWIGVDSQPDLIASMSKVSFDQVTTSGSSDRSTLKGVGDSGNDESGELPLRMGTNKATPALSQDNSNNIHTTTCDSPTSGTDVIDSTAYCLGDDYKASDVERDLLSSSLAPPSSLEEALNSSHPMSSTSSRGHAKSNTITTSTSGTLKKSREHPPSQRYRHGSLVTHKVDVWKYIMDNIGVNYQCFAEIPPFLDTSNVESFDWK